MQLNCFAYRAEDNSKVSEFLSPTRLASAASRLLSNSWTIFGRVYFCSTSLVISAVPRSMVARSRSLSVGQSPPESPHGVITSAVDLHANYGFDKAFPADHSAQWTWPIQTTLPYYNQILVQIRPTP